MDENSLQVPWKWKEVDDTNFWKMPDGSVMQLVYYLGKDPSKKVYDLGCGLGRHALFFASQGYQVVASDISEEAVKETIAELKEKGLTADVEQGRMTKINQPDNTFDLVIAYNVIYHAFKKDIVKTISEVYRILKPEGLFYGTFLSTDDWHSPFRDPVVEEKTIIKKGGPEDGIPHFFSDEEDVLEFLKDFKFIYLCLETYYRSPYDIQDKSLHFRFLVRKPK